MSDECSKEPAVYHIFEEQILRTFKFDDELYAVYSFNDDPELICSRVERRDISTVMAKKSINNVKGIIPKSLVLWNKASFSVLKYFGLEPLGEVYAVLSPKYDFIPAVQGWAYHWESFRRSVGEKAALDLIQRYVMSLPDEELYNFFFDGYRSVFVMNSWEKVESELKNADVNDPRVFDLLRESDSFFEEASSIHNRNEMHSVELKKLLKS